MESNKNIKLIAARLGLHDWQVENTIRLMDDGASIPFIARYRKEMTGSLDEVRLLHIRDEYTRLKELDARRETIIRTIEEQEKMTPELRERIDAAVTMAELEDIYLPYRPKRRTRATIAREKGLEPLAAIILEQKENDPLLKAEEFLNDMVKNVEEAVAGASDIIAEWVSEDEKARKQLRRLYEKEAVIFSKVVKGKESEGIKFSDYFDWSEPLRKCPSHRLLAMRRGEDEGILRLSVEPDEKNAVDLLLSIFIRGKNASSELVETAVRDSWKRLLASSMETEFRNISKEKADHEAIEVFADNLKQLLLAPPLGEKNVLAIDPGFRTGCKVVCLDRQGNLLHNETIYPHPPQNETALSVKKILTLVNAYKIEAIAIGNGTASRETEEFIKWVKLDRNIQVFVVSEAGASVYSASKVAREEFPDYDVTVRGAVSIGRRLMDPLAELVKIDPKSIGVGQYQHDVDQQKLQSSLDEVVVSCVNAVGVEVNTASRHLLTYVSGLGPQLAQNMVDYRTANGPFASRTELMNVKRMGAKAFEQCAGFLRIRNAENPLDSSAVHPESYHIVEKMAADLGCGIRELMTNDDKRKAIRLEKYITPATGLPTLKDIMEELAKPGRDPRSTIKEFRFADIHTMEDLVPGMIVPGIVTNVTKFGAFVDIGIKQDGLVHISNMSSSYVSDPSKVVKLHQHVMVKVLDVDIERRRIQLSMKGLDKK
ncbi:MAG: S1 RNA-binding domain-containing protein [Bacteroidales bacterium]|nr:S1 RNA-binding domain-containing protein [Bacteroidales bacterium]HPV17060.1 Tex family protein [Bacteroidales bacterium]HPX44375.1 Tex family protein [Bacteroidales bacterium]HQB86559.1 Tex family protein [Bacteroidales bacterium]